MSTSARLEPQQARRPCSGHEPALTPPVPPVPAAAPAAISATIAREALQWLLRLQGGEANAVDCQRWRAADPAHEQAWQRIEAVNGRLRPLQGGAAAGLAQATLSAAGRPRRRAIKLATLALGGATGAVLARQEQARWRPWLADLRTGHGERLDHRLPDGSLLQLNSDTALNIRYDDAVRSIELLRGELFIETASDPLRRPFRVLTPQGVIEALGTRFAVHDQGPATRVDVFEGRVRLSPQAGEVAPLVLEPGQRSRLAIDHLEAVTSANPDATAWRDGLLVASRMRLDDFIDELNRYSRSPLIVSADAAGLLLSGSYPLADIDLVLRTVARVLPLQVERRPRRWRGDEIHIGLRPPAG